MSAINHEATVRIETALSRYPLHHLSKAGGNAITLREGEVRWEVRYYWG
jgi:hypothetical protein